MTTRYMSPGRLIARILPKEVVDEYAKRHTKHLIDVEPLLKQLAYDDMKQLTPIPTMNIDACKDPMVLIQASIVQENVMKKVNLQRAWNEPAENTLKRLSWNLSPEQKVIRKKGKKDQMIKKNRQPPPRACKIIMGDKYEMNFSGITCSELWMLLAGKDARIDLPVSHTAFDVMQLDTIACAPMILAVNTFQDFEATLYCGVPIVVEAKLHHSNKAIISWFVNGELRAQDQESYIPTLDHIGMTISVLIYPDGHCTSDLAEAYQFLLPVEQLPNMPFVHSFRSEWTAPRKSDDDNLRIMTYNVLADQYTSKEGPKPDRMAYCSSEILHRGRRMPLLMHEILSYNADIVCLQEVDAKLYDSFYNPVLRSQGYCGLFSGKISGTQEGCAMFWLAKDFVVTNEQQDQQTYGIRELLSREEVDTDDEIWKKSFQHIKSLYMALPRVEVLVNDLGQVLQVVRLTCRRDSGRQIVIGNTHLYYHPYGDHIRALQALAICHKLDEIRRESNDCSILLTGDFNSDPAAGAIDLLLRRSVDPSHPEAWTNLLLHPRQKENSGSENLHEKVPPPTLCLPASFPTLNSAYTPNEESEFTHHVEGFIGILDYIFVSGQDFDVCRTAPLPSLSYMPDPLPTAEMASDHISLVCDLQWKHR